MATAAAAAARRARAINRIDAGATEAARLFALAIAPPARSKDPEANTSALLEHAADVIEALNATRQAPPTEEAAEAAPEAPPRRSKATL